jgi:hypothetical protein
MSVLILAAWLGTALWMLWTEMLPYLMPGTPPAFFIDLIEEAQQNRVITRWAAMKGGEKLFSVSTQVERLPSGLFELSAVYLPVMTPGISEPPRIHGLRVTRMASAYRVTHDGDLVGLSIQVEGQSVLSFTADIQGEVRRGRLSLGVTLQAGGQEQRFSCPEVEVPRGGSSLMPLHPVNRIRGLHPGQTWAMKYFDPLQAINRPGEGPTMLWARVRPHAEDLRHANRNIPCLVIDYQGDGAQASTWVNERTGQVIRQESTHEGEAWALVRE